MCAMNIQGRVETATTEEAELEDADDSVCSIVFQDVDLIDVMQLKS